MNIVSLPANPMAAIESHLNAKKTIDQIITFFEKRQRAAMLGRQDPLLPGSAPLAQWRADKTFIDHATPFFWARDPTVACTESSLKIPGDTFLNRWNLCHHAVWWHFERSLPWQTITDAEAPIVALSMGWGHRRYAGERDRFVINAWCPFKGGDDPQQPLSPSQVFNWIEGESLDAMLQRSRGEHRAQYGPGGEYEHASIVGEEIFLATAEKIARFVLAAFAWLNQKVVVLDDGHIERHRRKEYERVMNRKQPTIKVIQLRKREDAPKDDETDDGIDGTREVKKIDYTCRWVVTGHWRNQACGKQFAERRLVFIHPYVKGPDDKPVKESVPTLYKVSR